MSHATGGEREQDQLVQYRHEAGCATLTLNAPARGNALDLPLLTSLLEQVRQARRDDARVVVLRAHGSAWCVGGDLAPVGAAAEPGTLIDRMAETIHLVASELVRMPAVVVSVVHGTAAGAGVPLAAAADVVLAADTARFTMAYTKVGFTPDGGSTLLPASLGLHRALHLALLNPVLTAAEAHAIGLVAQVHPAEALDAAAQKVISILLAGSRTAQVGAKRLLRAQAIAAPEQAMRLETLSIRDAADGPDGREGVAAFLDKRPAAFPSAHTTVPA